MSFEDKQTELGLLLTRMQNDLTTGTSYMR